MAVFDLLNPDSTEVEEQRIISSPGATVGDVLTVQADKSIAAASGGGSQPIVSGSGSPVDTVTPTAGKPLYIDTTNGTLYCALGPTDTDWVALGPVAGNIGEATGLAFVAANRAAYLMGGERDTNGGSAYLTDAFSQWNGHGQGVQWSGGGNEGQETFNVKTGATGQHNGILQDGNGYMRTPVGGGIIIRNTSAPPDADLAASQVALWFDATNGAAKLKIKGKTANGTVVTGEVALA